MGPLGDFSNETSEESPARGLTFEEEEDNAVEEDKVEEAEGEDDNEAGVEEEGGGSPAGGKEANKLGEEAECDAKSEEGEEFAIVRPGGNKTEDEDVDDDDDEDEGT